MTQSTTPLADGGYECTHAGVQQFIADHGHTLSGPQLKYLKAALASILQHSTVEEALLFQCFRVQANGIHERAVALETMARRLAGVPGRTWPGFAVEELAAAGVKRLLDAGDLVESPRHLNDTKLRYGKATPSRLLDLRAELDEHREKKAIDERARSAKTRFYKACNSLGIDIAHHTGYERVAEILEAMKAVEDEERHE